MRTPEGGGDATTRITVVGGAGGAGGSASSVEAKLEDLRATSAALRKAASELDETARSVARVRINVQGAGALSPWTAQPCDRAATSLGAALTHAGQEAAGLACTMDLTVAAYELAEKTCAGLFGSHVADSESNPRATTLWAGIVGATNADVQAGAAAEAVTWLDAILPGSYEDAIAAMNAVSRAVYDPDAPAITRLVSGPGQSRAPEAATSVATSMKQVEAMYGDNEETSHIQVQRVVDPTTGQGHWVAMLPGTSCWSAHHGSVLNGADNLPALAGAAGEAEKAVRFALEDAMRREGVLDKHEPVMLVGHSQGGIVMTNLARHAAGSKLNVTKVVTYGSPVGRMKVPPRVRALNIENTRDLVPKADGWATGDGDLRRTRVVIDDPSSNYTADGHQNVLAAHDPATYRRDYQTAVERESKNATSGVTRFEKDSKVFFDGKAHTYQYDSRRSTPVPPAHEPPANSVLRPRAMVNPSTGGYVVTAP